MAVMTLDFAWNSVNLAKSWITGGTRVGGRNACSIPRTGKVAFGGVGIKDVGKDAIRLVWVASADPSGPSSQPPKPPRNSKRKSEGPTKSDLKLVGDLKEFICAYDLPPTEVPTTKELIRNGRQDLANAVRRRGYKTVAELLGITPWTGAADINPVDQCKDTAADSIARNVSENGAAGNTSTNLQQMTNKGKEETKGLATDGEDASTYSSPGGASARNSNGFVSSTENALREGLSRTEAHVPEIPYLDSQRKEFVGQTSVKRRGDYIQQRQLDLVKELAGASQTFDFLQKSSTGREDGDDSFVEDGDESGSDYTDDDEDDEDNDDSIEVRGGQTDANLESLEEVAAKKAALLRSRILEYFDTRKEYQIQPETSQDGRLSEQITLEQESRVLEKDVELENNQKLEVEKELERIKELLRERELVLAEVTKELEEAKAQFSLARAKATAELVHATQLAVEREARLKAAEQVLSSLRQVHLEWWGEAKHVELAGTFNGWQHRILMEPDPSSEIPKSDGSRGPMLWGTHLCLYPGVYEIKFVVDGNWQLDHRREVVMRHGNQNNVLRVEL